MTEATKAEKPKRTKKSEEAVKVEVAVNPAVAARRTDLTKRLYSLAGDPSKLDEFENVRKELESIGG